MLYPAQTELCILFWSTTCTTKQCSSLSLSLSNPTISYSKIPPTVTTQSNCKQVETRYRKYRTFRHYLEFFKKIMARFLVHIQNYYPTDSNPRRLPNIWERKILRRICGPVRVNNIWKNRTNNELRDLYGENQILFH